MSERILIVEDERAIREMVGAALVAAGFATSLAGDASEADLQIRLAAPRLVLLDWMLPGVGGVEFARRLRRGAPTRGMPIIMLTARCEEETRLEAFEAGVDDYVSKPFSVRELLARIKAVLRRSAGGDGEAALEVEGLRLDPGRHRVSSRGRSLTLRPSEFRLLHLFMAHQERVFTRGQLLDRVWGSHVYVEERTVDVHIRRLRKALAPQGHAHLVQTVYGVGYRFSRES